MDATVAASEAPKRRPNSTTRTTRTGPHSKRLAASITSNMLNGILVITMLLDVKPRAGQQLGEQPISRNGFQLHRNQLGLTTALDSGDGAGNEPAGAASARSKVPAPSQNNSTPGAKLECAGGLLTFELLTGFIYKPTSGAETLSMMLSTLQLTDCLDHCLHNSSCLAINFEMGLCVLLAQSARQNQHSLFTSQFPVFTIYAEKKCLLTGGAPKRKRCQRAWSFERVAGFEMKTKPRRRLQGLASKEACMDACLLEADFECRSANWHRRTGECQLSDQDRHSVSQSEAGGQQQLEQQPLYGAASAAGAPATPTNASSFARLLSGHATAGLLDKSRLSELARAVGAAAEVPDDEPRQPGAYFGAAAAGAAGPDQEPAALRPASALVDYLENNCIHEPNRLCEFHKIQNKVLKTVDSIYQDVASLDECKQKCLNAPYRCYSFDYGDTAERVCRTSHLDQASLVSVREPYLEVAGAITYELASCFNVTVQCRAREMVALVSASKMFKGKIYAKSRPSDCVNDVRDSLKFELSMRYHDDACDVRSGSGDQQRGVFTSDIVIQHHDRIVTSQDVGLSLFCHYDLGNRSVSTNQVDLAIERLADSIDSKQSATGAQAANSSPLTITGLATAVVRSPNVTMRITNMNGQPVSSATVGDRLALMFEIKEKSSPFGIFVREIVAMDGRQLLALAAENVSKPVYYYADNNSSAPPQQHQQLANLLLNETAVEALQLGANSLQFIDSSGCPTDSNLMGPLVKMDPHGHRLLAPFDAFKFPSSDMVFFRAVVSSCVAECKPAVCAPSAQVETAPGFAPIAPEQTLFGPTAAAHANNDGGRPASETQFELESRSTPTLVASAGSTSSASTTTSAPSSPPPLATEGALRRAATSTTSQPAGEQQASSARERSSASADQAGADSTVTVPGFGPSAVPTTTASSWAVATDTNSADSSAPVDATSNVALSNNHLLGAHLPPRRTTSGAQQHQQTAELDSVSLLTDQQRQSISELLMDSSVPLQTAFAGALESAGQAARGTPASEPRRPVDAALDRLLARGVQPAPPADLARANATSIDSLLAKYAELEHLLQHRPTGSGDEFAPTSGQQQLARTPQKQAKLKGKAKAKDKDKERQQALADSYLGAFQSMGRRRKRQADEADLIAKSSYALQLEHAGSNYGDEQSAATKSALFTHGIVEMYHANCEQLRDLHRAKRQALEQAPPQQSAQQEVADELVVQSIKILDRLQFDGEQMSSRKATSEEHNWKPQAQLDGHKQELGKQKQRQIAHSSSRLPSSMQMNTSDVQPLPRLGAAMGIFLVAVCFVFVQISMLLVCLIDWNQRSKRTDPTADGNNDVDDNEAASNPEASMTNYCTTDCSTLGSLSSPCSTLSVSTSLGSLTLASGHDTRRHKTATALARIQNLGSPAQARTHLIGNSPIGGRREQRLASQLGHLYNNRPPGHSRYQQ